MATESCKEEEKEEDEKMLIALLKSLENKYLDP